MDQIKPISAVPSTPTIDTLKHIYSPTTYSLSTQGQKLTLSNKRILSFCEYAQNQTIHPQGTNNDNISLIPVILFHGTPGSRLFVHPTIDIDPILDLNPGSSSSDPNSHSSSSSRNKPKYVPGLQLFVIERPGFGYSTPRATIQEQQSSIAEYVHSDLREFLRYKNIKSFACLGYSAGAPYALACASVYGPTHQDDTHTAQCVKAVVVGCVAPLSSVHFTTNISFMAKVATFLLRYMPSVAKWVLRINAAHAAKDPVESVLEGFRMLHDCDVKLCMDLSNGVLEHFTRSLCETICNPDQAGNFANLEFQEYSLWKNWGFEPKGIVIPVVFYHGALDMSCSPIAAESLAKEIPSAAFHHIQDIGHMVYFTHFQEIVQELLNL